jgi:hypothetical protein
VYSLYGPPKPIAASNVQGLPRNVEHIPTFSDRCRARINGVDSVNNAALKPLDAQTGFRPFMATCRGQIDGGFFAQVGRLRESRVLVADPARGIVVIASTIDHAGAKDTIDVKGVGTMAMPEPFRPPSTTAQVVVISVRGGRITHIETVERPLFYGMSLGWTG